MRAQLLRGILISGLLTAVYASAYSQTEELLGTSACFRVRDVRSWTVLDDSTLIVQAPMARNSYLVKLFRPVQGLGFERRLAFQDVSRMGRICDRDRDNLLVQGPMQARVPIVAVRQLSDSERTRLVASAGRGAVSHTSPR